jgi:hypothetical protein
MKGFLSKLIWLIRDGSAVAVWGMRVLTALLANGRENFTLRAELNGQVLAMTAVVLRHE